MSEKLENLDNEIREDIPVMVISKCLTTTGICKPGEEKGLARYPPLREYNLLKTNFQHIFELARPSRYSSVILLGEFLVTFNQDEIKYNFYNSPRTNESFIGFHITLERFETLMKQPVFKSYLDLWITKTVQDYMVYKQFNIETFGITREVSFEIALSMTIKRESDSVGFHVDSFDDVPCNYITLTYMLPNQTNDRNPTYDIITPGKHLILSASILSDLITEGRYRGKYTTMSFAISDLCTLGLTSRGYKGELMQHSTPLKGTSKRLFDGRLHSSVSNLEKDNIGSMKIREGNVERENIETTRNLVIARSGNLQNSEEDDILNELIENTNNDRRFLQVYYIEDYDAKNLLEPNMSDTHRVECNLQELLNEITSQINYLTTDDPLLITEDPVRNRTLAEYALGGKRSKKRSTRTSKRKRPRKNKSRRLKRYKKIDLKTKNK